MRKVVCRFLIMLLIIVGITACGTAGEAVKTPEELQQDLDNIAADVSDGNKEQQGEKDTESDEAAKSDKVGENAEEDAESPAEYEPVQLIFTGDVMPYDCVLDNYAGGIAQVVDETLLDELNAADITMVNQEFPFSTRGTKAPDKQFTFRIDPKKVTLLTDMGVDVVTIANNHTLDFGDDALYDTFDTLDDAGILYAGAGDSEQRARQLITIEKNGKVFGFLAASRVIPVTSWNVENHVPGLFTTYDPTKLLEDIKKAKEQCDFLTVYVHWGIERAERPETYQRTMGKQYIDAGADLVVGSHPHVLQGFEYYQGKYIVYSLGNFIFNHTISSTALLKVEVDGDNQASIRLIPGYAKNAYTQAMEQSEAETLFRYLESISYGVTVTEEGYLQGE